MASTMERWCARCSATVTRLDGKWWCHMCVAFVKGVKPGKGQGRRPSGRP